MLGYRIRIRLCIGLILCGVVHLVWILVHRYMHGVRDVTVQLSAGGFGTTAGDGVWILVTRIDEIIAI